MTDTELEELINHCPTLYHMAERGSWESIREKGLMSTSALLDHYGVKGSRRKKIEQCHRPESVPIEALGMSPAVIRDQGPMSDAGLQRALPEHMKPSDWYRLLNSKVFFWLTKERLYTLTTARTYCNRTHDVLEVDTKSLIDSHREKIWFCPINSGCTKPYPHKRDESAFSRIEEYKYSYWYQKRRKSEHAVVELAVDYMVPDITKHIRRVVVMHGRKTVSIITNG